MRGKCALYRSQPSPCPILGGSKSVGVDNGGLWLQKTSLSRGAVRMHRWHVARLGLEEEPLIQCIHSRKYMQYTQVKTCHQFYFESVSWSKQLPFLTHRGSFSEVFPFFPVHYVGVSCGGSESSLLECIIRNGSGLGITPGAVFVVCRPETADYSGEFERF